MSENSALLVRIYGSHRRLLPEGDEARVPYVSGETVKGLLSRLNVPLDEVGALVVNGILVSQEFVLSPGDQVSIMSPVAGG
ncbi:MAG: MoaD/ThiS family protein [Bacillota bacterium]|nr:thiamine S protein [Candidatus Fermentithermobacillaceae bacterium]